MGILFAVTILIIALLLLAAAIGFHAVVLLRVVMPVIAPLMRDVCSYLDSLNKTLNGNLLRRFLNKVEQVEPHEKPDLGDY